MSEPTDYVAHSEALEAAGMACDESPPCVVCARDVSACAVCGVCRECHPAERYWHMSQLMAAWQCEADGKCAQLVRVMGDDDLRAFSESPDADGFVRKYIRAEVGFRHMVKRADELGCDAYCPEHDCDTRNCPSGAHGED